MNISKLFFITLLSWLTLTVSAAEQFQVLDRGSEGDQRFYAVVCPDGSQASVVQTFDDNGNVSQVCIHPAKGKEDICKTSWDHISAAKDSCRL